MPACLHVRGKAALEADGAVGVRVSWERLMTRSLKMYI
jgi:hypothetical protein